MKCTAVFTICMALCLGIIIAPHVVSGLEKPAPNAQKVEGKITAVKGGRLDPQEATLKTGDKVYRLELDEKGRSLTRVMHGQQAGIWGIVSEKDGDTWLKVLDYTDTRMSAGHELWRHMRCSACVVTPALLNSVEPSKRIAASAMAIHGKLTVQDLTTADLPYAPPFSPAVDNLIAAAHVLENKMHGRMKGISARDLKAKVDAGEDLFILDTRGPDEYEQMRLGIGEVLIPLGALRRRLNELPEDKGKEIVCFCKISLRGYEAESLLEAHGWTNVKVMEGGIMAWPFAREK